MPSSLHRVDQLEMRNKHGLRRNLYGRNEEKLEGHAVSRFCVSSPCQRSFGCSWNLWEAEHEEEGAREEVSGRPREEFSDREGAREEVSDRTREEVSGCAVDVL